MGSIGETTKDIKTTVSHIARDPLYLKEKPYAVEFDCPGQRSNHVFEDAEVTIHDARPTKSDFTLDKNGFCYVDCPTTATLESLESDLSVRDEYYKEMENIILSTFPEYSRVDVIDHQVRRREAGYPVNVGSKAKTAQPARLPHSDYSVAGLFHRMKLACPGQEKLYEGKDIDILNVWRVLKGPNNDWPLAMCDYTSINTERDSIVSDIVSANSVGENELLHTNPQHRWYYLSDQRVEELIIFRNANSRGQGSRSFHSAFDTGIGADLPRESVEIHLIAFRRE